MALQTLKQYEQLLAEAIRLRKKHETRAKDFIPRMYEILAKSEGLTPQDAADRIYKDLVGIWEKDTIRRLLPIETKNQSARERQALSRMSIKSSGVILQTEEGPDDKSLAELERQNSRLQKTVDILQEEKKSLLEKSLRLERMLAQHQAGSGNSRLTKSGEMKVVVMPPHLFIKTFTLMRSSTKPLVLKIAANEVVDVDKVGTQGSQL